MLDEPHGVLRARAAKGIEEEVEQRVQIPLGQGFAGRIAAQRRAIVIDDVDHADVLNPILREKGIRSLLGVPLLIEGRVLGVMHVGSLTPRIFTSEDRDLLQHAADRAALAIEHAAAVRAAPPRGGAPAAPPSASAREHPRARARQPLPAREPEPGRRLVRRVRAGSRPHRAGGRRRRRPRPDAAAVMAQLRTALRAYAIDGHPPEEVVERLNRLMWTLGPTVMTTLAYLVMDPVRETVDVVIAGHPPPLVIGPGGDAAYLPLQGTVALGASPAARYRCDSHPFPVGSTVVLYTDGLVEERGASIDAGLERLRAVTAAGGDLEPLCEAIVAQLVPETPADDIAIDRRASPAAHARDPGRAGRRRRRRSRSVRALLRRWLHAQGATEEEAYDIIVASQEACANAVEHAYGPERRSFEVEATHDEGEGPRRGARQRTLAAPARQQPRPRLTADAALMEHVEVTTPKRGPWVLERTLGEEGRMSSLARVAEERLDGGRDRRHRGRHRRVERERDRAIASPDAVQPQRDAGGRPHADDLHGQRRTQRAVQARRPTCSSASRRCTSSSCRPRRSRA